MPNLDDVVAEMVVMRVLFAHTIATQLRQARDPLLALRALSESVNASIDKFPFGTGIERGDKIIETMRLKLQIILDAAKIQLSE